MKKQSDREKPPLLTPNDPGHPDHPSHDAQWDELARALGRAMADRDFDRLYGKPSKGRS